MIERADEKKRNDPELRQAAVDYLHDIHIETQRALAALEEIKDAIRKIRKPGYKHDQLVEDRLLRISPKLSALEDYIHDIDNVSSPEHRTNSTYIGNMVAFGRGLPRGS